MIFVYAVVFLTVKVLSLLCKFAQALTDLNIGYTVLSLKSRQTWKCLYWNNNSDKRLRKQEL